MTLYNDVFCLKTGIAFFPIETKKWEVVSSDLFTGLKDKNEADIYERDKVKLYFKGQWVECEIVYHNAMFCLKWPDGYINKHPLNPEKYEVITKLN
jgi:hypothetical protein